MLERPPAASPRAEDDYRMDLYYDRDRYGTVRWYVKIGRQTNKERINEEYSTDVLSPFHIAWEAAVRKLGGEPRFRRSAPEVMPTDPRSYLHPDPSHRGQSRWYVQLRNGIPKIRIRAKHGTPEFDRLYERAVEVQIAKYGDGTQRLGDMKRQKLERFVLPEAPPKEGTLRFYWDAYRLSDHWLGNPASDEIGLSPETREQRVRLMEPLLYKNGEKPFALFTRTVMRHELDKRKATPSQGGNLLSAVKGMANWMIREELLDPEDDPTLGVKSGKARATRESGGFVPWSSDDMVKFPAYWALGTEARLMFEILRCTHLRVGDAHRFGSSHLVDGDDGEQYVYMELEKGARRKGTPSIVEMPLHPDLIDALNAMNMLGEDVFTGKLEGGLIVPMTKESWAAKFKAYCIEAGVNEAKKNCHGVRKARAMDAAYSGMTESEMCASFGWDDPKMAAYYIRKAKRLALAKNGMAKLIARDQNKVQIKRFGKRSGARDQSENIVALKAARSQNGWVTRVGNGSK